MNEQLSKIAAELRSRKISIAALQSRTRLPGDDYSKRSGPSILAQVATDAGVTQKEIIQEFKRQEALHANRRALARRLEPSLLYYLSESEGKTIIYGRFAKHLKKIAVLSVSREERGDRFINIGEAGLIDYDRENRLWLLSHSAYCKYSSRESWGRTAAWLAGHDPDQPSGYFCRRVPASCQTVGQALAWMMPAEVKKARAEGRRVVRQGDVYLVEMKRGDNLRDLPARHTWNPETRQIEHPEHGAVSVPYPVKAIPQKNLTGFSD